jgi:hypothetical protein
VRKLSQQQRKRLEDITTQITDIELKIWGLLSPSSERDAARMYLHATKKELTKLLKQPEQMELDI